jgi:hypothetical protein
MSHSLNNSLISLFSCDATLQLPVERLNTRQTAREGQDAMPWWQGTIDPAKMIERGANYQDTTNYLKRVTTENIRVVTRNTSSPAPHFTRNDGTRQEPLVGAHTLQITRRQETI